MKKANAGKLLIIVVFITITAIPLVLFNHGKGVLSPTENRYLADFPIIFDEAGNINSNIKSEFGAWFDDHLGMREKFVWLQAMMKVHGLHQSSSEKVHIGKDGWFFYTQEDDLKIADGTYPLSEELLMKFAENQQAISDYYKSQGTEYVLVLTPSKASVYPEYIGGANYEVGISPVDIAESYLKQHTDIYVVNVKYANIQSKDVGAQFLKTDTHWTHRGSYAAYRAVAEYLNNLSIISTQPVEVSYSESKQAGEFSFMLGGNILKEEIVPVAQWAMNSSFVTEGEQYEQMEQVRQQSGSPYGITYLKNDRAENKRLLIYGDSQWETARIIPQLLAEHFSEVISFSMNTNPSILMDEVVRPDVVICSCSERYINIIGNRELSVPKLIQQLPALPEEPAQTADYWIGTNGICLDSCNGESTGNADSFAIQRDAKQVELVGWAADFKTRQPLSALYLQVGERVIQCGYGIERTSVSDHYQDDNLKNTGFSVTFPAFYLREGAVDQLLFIQVGTDGTYRYEPVRYSVST